MPDGVYVVSRWTSFLFANSTHRHFTIMYKKDRDLQSQVATLQNEIELSTFLNKGVLQTNSEYKLKIVELERENAVLRVAESRLSRTEDRLEILEKRLREAQFREAQLEEEIEEMKLHSRQVNGSLEKASRKLEAIGKLAMIEEINAGPSMVSTDSDLPLSFFITLSGFTLTEILAAEEEFFTESQSYVEWETDGNRDAT